MYKRILLLAIVVLFCIGWTNNPGLNTPVCTAESEQKRPQLISDGQAGAGIIWEDSRKGSDYDIYAQRIDSKGLVQWPVDGIAICTAGGPQRYPQIISDGLGGFIIAWYDRRNGKNYDIYAQRVDLAGMVQWTADGTVICAAIGDQYDPMLAADGQGGAIIIWYDRRNGSDYDIYGQRIDSSGKVQWIADGIGVCTAVGDQDNPRLVADDQGGVIITWQDRQNGDNYDIFAQRLDPFGRVQWTAKGVSVCAAAHDQRGPHLVPDGKGGAIITWQDKRTGSDYNIYAQRIDSRGLVQWTTNGMAICTAANSQYDPRLVPDGRGGAIITWQDYRKGSDCNYDAFARQTDFDVRVCTEKQLHDWNIYAQLIDSSGKVKWAANGVAICAAQLDQYKPQLVSDGRGGAIVAWRVSDKESDIYAQRLNPSGLVIWSANGIKISTAKGSQFGPILVPDGSGGAIITWHDKRNGNHCDIYSQRVRASGKIGG